MFFSQYLVAFSSFSVGVGAFVIGLSRISSFFSSSDVAITLAVDFTYGRMVDIGLFINSLNG